MGYWVKRLQTNNEYRQNPKFNKQFYANGVEAKKQILSAELIMSAHWRSIACNFNLSINEDWFELILLAN